MENLPLVVVTLTRGGSFTSKDIWEILVKQKGCDFELALLKEEDVMLIHPGMAKKAKVEVTFKNGSSLGKELNKLVEECRNEVFCFIRNDTQPTHDHWLKRVVAPFQDSSVTAVKGREVTIPDANYLVSDELERRFDVKTLPAETFSLSNSAISRKALSENSFDEKATDPLLVWAINNDIKPILAKEAMSMRETRVPFAQIYRESFENGRDLAIASKSYSMIKALFCFFADISRDSFSCLKKRSPQHIWFPLLHWSNRYFGLYLGGKSL